MPRVSSAPEDAFHFKGSFEEGWGEIVDAKSVVFQYPPQKEASGNRPAGFQSPPGLFVCLSIQRYLDKTTKAGVPAEEVMLSLAAAGKDTGMLDSVHPGRYPNGDLNAEPEDCGAELGTEGDTIVAIKDGFALNDKTKWMTFATSLTEKGFKPAELKASYFPALIGTIAHFKNETRKGSGNIPNYDVFVVSEIAKYGYENKKKGAAKDGSKEVSKSGANAPSSGATRAEATDEAQGAESGAIETVCRNLAAAMVSKNKGATLTDIKKARLAVLMEINNHKPPITDAALRKGVQDTVTFEWLQEYGLDTGSFDVQPDNKVVFAP